ncbi:MAG: histidine phosphatase family protein [Deltaproteobacteria bacterium]|nr:histidine phosphatase family protein [Deltaproteobacteria bacterium]
MRHGETTGQSSIRYYGATDVPLSPVGEAQMRRAGAALAGQRFDAVYSSCLSRARRGAELVAQCAPTPVAAFDEVHFGRWEGLTRDEIAARDPQLFARWQADPERFAYPDGECRRAFQRRVSDGLAALLAAPVGPHRLLVVHRGVIAVALAELLGLDPAQRRALDIGLGSIHMLARDAHGWRRIAAPAAGGWGEDQA